MVFTVEPLPRQQIRAVYPLVRATMPGLGLEAWLRFARGATAPRRVGRSGIIVARRTGHDFPSGLFCYRVDRDPVLERVLVAEHFAAMDLLRPDDVIAVLVEELDRLGGRLGCRAVRSVVHRPDVAGGLTQAGHASAGSLLGKALAPDQTSPRADGNTTA